MRRVFCFGFFGVLVGGGLRWEFFFKLNIRFVVLEEFVVFTIEVERV